MMPWFLLPIAALAGVITTGVVTYFLRKKSILDHPNERSSHSIPTPRGGGWGILLVLVPGWGALGVTPALLVGLVGLAGVSWLDDRRGLPPLPRLLVQVAAVGLGLWALGDRLVFQGWLPDSLDHVLAALCWLWFINVFNFMDGIDGIAGSEAASVAIGLALTAAVAGAAPVLIGPALVLAGAALGFLAWNWQPARVFMGDIGSVPVGFALGWLLLSAAATGLWLAALLLPLYFLADATLTLVRRLAAGQRVWQAHREHFYQKAVQNGCSHAQVVRAVLVTNSVLLGLVLTLSEPWALAGGLLMVGGLLWWLRVRHASPVSA